MSKLFFGLLLLRLCENAMTTVGAFQARLGLIEIKCSSRLEGAYDWMSSIGRVSRRLREAELGEKIRVVASTEYARWAPCITETAADFLRFIWA